MKTLLLYIKKINILTFSILFVLFPSQTKSESVNVFTQTPVRVNPVSKPPPWAAT